jgi:hypothetical protein
MINRIIIAPPPSIKLNFLFSSLKEKMPRADEVKRE